MTPIEQIKAKLKIEELIAESLTLTGKGRVLSTKEHDSLKIFVDSQSWYRFSLGIGGDVFDWYQMQHGCDFRTALEELAQRTGVELQELSKDEREELDFKRAGLRILNIAAHYYNQVLLHHPDAEPAREYCMWRRWNPETAEREQIGFVLGPQSPRDKNDLSVEEFNQPPLHRQLIDAGLDGHPMAKLVLSIPQNMLVYVHRRGGQVLYLSGRSIEGKRHFNLPLELEVNDVAAIHVLDKKALYINTPAQRTFKEHVLVEGQADAISLGELGCQATALAGVTGELPAGITHVWFDNDAPGSDAGLQRALEVGPLVRMVRCTDPDVKDANDFLVKGGSKETLETMFEASEPAIVVLARQAGLATGSDQDKMICQLMDLFDELPSMTSAKLRNDLAKEMGFSISDFNAMRKARSEQREREAKEKSTTSRCENSPGVAVGGYVFEQCVFKGEKGELQVRYAVRNPDGKIELRFTVDAADVTYIPFPATMGVIKEHVVLFPEKPEPYGDQRKLVHRVQTFIHKYLDLDPFYERLAAYYILFTWVYDLFDTLPYLRALGDYGTGKTRFLQTIGSVCYRPMLVSGASTVSPVFRLIDMFRGTLVVDEADFSSSDTDNEMIKIYNLGYDRHGVVLRSIVEKGQDGLETHAPSVHKVFGPKLLATRRQFDDRATESRCLTRRMTTARPRPGIPYTLGAEFWEEAKSLRNKLLMYRLENHQPVEIDQAMADESVEPRLNQVTMALKTIVRDPQMRTEIDMFVRAYNDLLIQERSMSMEAVVLQAIVDIAYGDTDLYDNIDLSIGNVAEVALKHLQDLDPDEKLSAKRAGCIIRDFLQLKTDTIKSGPKKNRNGVVFSEAELLNLMRRYGIPTPEKPIKLPAVDNNEAQAAPK